MVLRHYNDFNFLRHCKRFVILNTKLDQSLMYCSTYFCFKLGLIQQMELLAHIVPHKFVTHVNIL
jgi:hypothetical protein